MPSLDARPVMDGLIAPIERAVKQDRVTGLSGVLASLYAGGAFDHGLFPAARAERYARRLIWADPAGRFTIVAMTWAPGQESPVHDHGGLWGAEIVVDGLIEETAYAFLESGEGGRFRLVPEREQLHPSASVGVLIPPLEYHRIRNAGATVARTLHVYGGAFDACTAFERNEDDWWSASRSQMHYDA